MTQHSADMRAFMSGRGIKPQPIGGGPSYMQGGDSLGRHHANPTYRNIGGTEYKVSRHRVEVGTTHYYLTALIGEWPTTDEAKLALFYGLDGGTIFGGEIEFTDDAKRSAKVRVWTD